MDRLRRLFSHSASLPWLLFIWSAAEILERVEFIARKTHELRETLMTPYGPVAVLAVSVVALIVVVAWPHIAQYIPAIRKPIHERVRSIEVERIPRLDQKYESLDNKWSDKYTEIEKSATALDKRIDILQGECNAVASEVKASSTKLTDVVDNIEAHRHGLASLSSDLSELKSRSVNQADIFERRFDSLKLLGQSFEHHVLAMHDITVLIAGYGTLIEHLQDIIREHSPVSAGKEPCSQPWWSIQGTDQISVDWSIHFNRFVNNCHLVVLQSGLQPDDVMSTKLREYANWNSRDGIDDCMREFGFQASRLKNLRQSYAGSLASLLSARETKS